jgi:hypothetical protein
MAKNVLAYIFLIALGLVVFLVGVSSLARCVPSLLVYSVSGVVGFWVVKVISDARYGEGAWRFIVGLSNDANGETEKWRNKIGENTKFWGLVGVVVFFLLQWALWEMLELTLDDAALRFFEMGRYRKEW